jgi:hypothetical protein
MQDIILPEVKMALVLISLRPEDGPPKARSEG